MKKLIALLLALVMVMALVACGAKNETPAEDNNANVEQTPETPDVVVPGSALEVLETIWGKYTDDEKFPTMGGDMNNIVDGAPGAYGLEDVETLGVQLLVPAEEVGNITEAASLFHGMMLNNFSCGVFKVAEGVDAAAFAETMHNAVANARWMCGMPEKELIAVIGGQYVLMVFGINDAVNPFEAKLTEAYPDATIAYSQAIG
jgi:predicted small lipoprotein YifL